MKLTGFLDSNAFRVLETLINKPFHLRELAEEMGLAPSTIYKNLSRFQRNKMVLVENVKNRKIFRLNSDSPLTNLAVGFLMTDKIIHSKAFSKLVRLKPKGIFLFGTAHNGKMTATSDIDLAVFFEKKPDSFKLSQIKSVLSNELSREVDLIVLTKEKVQSMREEEAELLNQIVNKSTVLWGEPIDLD